MDAFNDSSKIVDVKLTNLNDGKEIPLYKNLKENNRCHFFEPFEYNGRFVRFRLDWKPDKNKLTNEPVLDAELHSNIPIGKKTRLSNDLIQHHTNRVYDASTECYLYDFEFQGLKLKLSLKRTVQNTITSDSVIVKP